MGIMRPFSRRTAMGQIIGSKEIGFRRIAKNVVAGIDAGVKMSVDETRRDETALGLDLLIHRLRICFAHVLNPISVEYDDTVFDNFVFLAVEGDHMAALYKSFHCLCLSDLEFGPGAGLTKEGDQDKRPIDRRINCYAIREQTRGTRMFKRSMFQVQRLNR